MQHSEQIGFTGYLAWQNSSFTKKWNKNKIMKCIINRIGLNTLNKLRIYCTLKKKANIMIKLKFWSKICHFLKKIVM
jgi:uncharacterized protein (UPF0333 family)